MIQGGSTASFFWLLYALGLVLVLLIIGLFAYVLYCVKIKKYSFTWPLEVLKNIFIFLYWVLFTPIFESMVSVFRCVDGYQVIDRTMKCYGVAHIILMVVSAIFGLVLFFMGILISLLFHIAQPVPEDALARMETNVDVVFTLHRAFIVVFSTFVNTVIQSSSSRASPTGS